MTKTKKVTLNRSSDLEAVDQELDEAMDRLTSENNKIDELLAGLEPPAAPDDASVPEGTPEQSASEEEGDSNPENIPAEESEPNPGSPPQEPESEKETAS